jgi:hypothetical protein
MPDKIRDLSEVYLYNGSTLIGTASFNGTSNMATSTLTNVLNLPVNVDTLITVKADLSMIGTGQAGTEGDLVKVDPLNFEGTGASSGQSIKGTATPGVSGVRMFKSFPTVALGTLAGNGISDGHLIRFQVTADSHGNVGIAQFKFTGAVSSGTTVTNVSLYGYTDAGYSTAISGVGTSGLVNTAPVANGVGTFAVTPTASSIGAVEVPAGTTYYFELRGTVSGSGTNYNVATTFLGDSTVTGSMAAATTVEGTSNLVWSPNALTTSATSTLDWTNSTGVVGLPSSGLVQNRTN